MFELAERSKFTMASVDDASADGQIIFLSVSQKKKAALSEVIGFLDAATRKLIEEGLKRFDFKPKEGAIASFDKDAQRRVVVAVLPNKREAFSLLELARKALEPLKDAKCKRVLVDLRASGLSAADLAEAIVAAHLSAAFVPKSYQEDKDDPEPLAALAFVPAEGSPLSLDALKSAAELACAGNLVRYLSGMAGNDRTPTRYVALAKQLAKAGGLDSKFYSLDKLESLKAGAFLAVSQSAHDRGGGILQLGYFPARAKAKVALVGKGITFDTGGTQLKPGEHMFGMNGDMNGSAVALALVLLAKRQKWPWAVTSYLAITENMIGPTAYKPNDVVKTMKGKTIEVVDSDAEGRMVLADTLWLAATHKPDLMMDFATLTGACLRAIGTSYSGAYTNRSEFYQKITDAGRVSGERVWPFPNDRDLGRCLKSEIADLKQCRVTGGSDHIEAGYFLSEFVPEAIPWVHVDLSAAESEEGLAHVSTKLTGFGPRFAAAFLRGALL